MQVLFCHDVPLRVDNEGTYYGIAHNNDMFNRYRKISQNIASAIRVNKIKDKEIAKSLSQITISPFQVLAIPNISSAKGLLKRKKAKQIIKKAVLDSDYVVARLP